MEVNYGLKEVHNSKLLKYIGLKSEVCINKIDNILKVDVYLTKLILYKNNITDKSERKNTMNNIIKRYDII